MRTPDQKHRTWLRQAVLAHRAGRLHEALPLYKRVLHGDPRNTDALYGCGMLAWQLGELDTALRCLRTVVARRPDWPDAHYNLGVISQTAREHWYALASFRKAIELRPTFFEAWGSLGAVLWDIGTRDQARECFERAIALAPPDSVVSHEARYNNSYALLMMGQFLEGWAAHEERFNAPLFLAGYIRRHEQPAWDGSPLAGRRLLVHAEQGFGDSLWMARYLALIEGDVTIEVQAPLVRLFEASFPGRLVVPQGQPLPHPVDCQVAMMSLPHRFRTTLETIPQQVPYLTPPAGGPTLPAGDGLRVGFVWAGSKDHRNDRNRSIALEHWRPLFGVPGIAWYSLQVDQEPVGLPCHNLKPLIRDYAETAALVQQLDLVIGCDTSVVHLAGALGRPVWTLLPANGDFRWMLEDTTPWYPTMRLFRQETAGDWPGVMRTVAGVLQAVIQGIGLEVPDNHSDRAETTVILQHGLRRAVAEADVDV